MFYPWIKFGHFVTNHTFKPVPRSIFDNTTIAQIRSIIICCTASNIINCGVCYIATNNYKVQKSSLEDERVVLEDLKALRPFQHVEGRSFDSFNDISLGPIHIFDKSKFGKWIARHKKNMLVHHTVLEDDED